MRLSGCFSKAAALGLGLAAMVAAVGVQAEPGKAVVRSVRGTADFSDGGSWMALKVGKVLRAGAKIRTQPASTVDLFLDANGPVVRVTENTELGLDKLAFEQTGSDSVIDTQLDLKLGRILGKVNKLASASKYEIKTPVGVAAIKGTEYDISANGVFRVIEGEVLVAFSRAGQAQQQAVRAGEVFTPTGGGPTPIDPATLRDSIAQLRDSINLSQGPEGVVIIQPNEPFVSPVISKDSGKDKGTPTGK